MRIIPNILIFCCGMEDTNILKSYLMPKEYDIAVASKIEEALNITASGSTDLVIIDITAQDTSGLKLAERMRIAENLCLIPIIMIVDASRNEMRQKGIEAGCDDFISKPFDGEDVKIRVDTALELSRHRSLLDAKEKFDHVVHNMDNGLIIFDRNLKAIHFNNKSRELLEIQPHEKRFDFLEHVHRKFEVIYAGDLNSDVRSKSAVFDLVRPKTADTKLLILEARSNIIKNPLRGMGDILVILTNVTDQREEEFLKQDFLGLISHKLQTPIAVIQSAISLFQDGLLGPITAKQKASIEVISDRLDRLCSLVSKLLNFTTIGRNVLYLHREKIMVKEYLPSFVGPMVGTKNDKKVTIAVDCPDKNVSLTINRAHLGLIISNLVDNAIKFNDKDDIRITIKAENTAEGARVSVLDNGRGIPPEEKEKIFEKFYQVEKDFTGNVEGAGLSLAMVKLLVLAYGGKIELQSELGKGSSFIMTFPDNPGN